jgi:hypothetical protein
VPVDDDIVYLVALELEEAFLFEVVGVAFRVPLPAHNPDNMMLA